MIHILLLILKIIGITILAVLGLILLVLALVLFVPVFYRVKIIHNPRQTKVSAKVSFLWPVVSVAVQYLKKLSYTVRIFGIPILDSEKPKKEKKPKVKKEKPKKEKLPEKPEKRLPKKKVIVTFVFAFSILVAILLLEFIVPPMFSLSAAREAFEQGDYKTAYLEYYGKKLSEEDELKFQGITTIMRMQSNLDGYHNYLAIDEEVMAVHSLLEGVNVRTDIFMKAEAYGVTSEVNRIYDEILNLLSSNYGLSESDAIAITEIQSDVTYTNELNSIVGGNFESVEYEEEAVEDIIEEVITEEVVEEYLLPEELEMLQGGE